MEDVVGLITKILQLLLFGLVSALFLPIIFIAHHGVKPYEEWWDSIRKL
jgi:hypothetical protein